MSHRELPTNKNRAQRFLYNQGIKELGDGALYKDPTEVRMKGFKRVNETIVALSLLALSTSLVYKSAEYALEHGSTGPLHNGPEVTQTQDPTPPAESTPAVRTMSPTDISLPK